MLGYNKMTHVWKILLILAVMVLIWGMDCVQEQKQEQKKMKQVSSIEGKENLSSVKISILYDNYQYDPRLKTSWGFSSLIEVKNKTILFDTGGDSRILLSNMKKLGIDLKEVDLVIISHIHGDHTGGLNGFLETNSNVTVYIPQSFSPSFEKRIKNRGAKFVSVHQPQNIIDGIYTTGELYGPPKEQSLIVNSKKGLIVITGCAHPGIVHIVKKAKELMKKDNVYLVMGGFHHPPLSVVEELKKLGVKKVAPSHCTGDSARKAFAQEYKENYIESGTGKVIEID